MCQAFQAEKRETEEEMTGKVKEKNDEKGEAVVLDKEEEDKEGDFDPEGTVKEEKEKTTEEAKTPKAPRRPKTLQIKVTLLDDTLLECELDVSTIFLFFLNTKSCNLIPHFSFLLLVVLFTYTLTKNINSTQSFCSHFS